MNFFKTSPASSAGPKKMEFFENGDIWNDGDVVATETPPPPPPPPVAAQDGKRTGGSKRKEPEPIMDFVSEEQPPVPKKPKVQQAETAIVTVKQEPVTPEKIKNKATPKKKGEKGKEKEKKSKTAAAVPATKKPGNETTPLSGGKHVLAKEFEEAAATMNSLYRNVADSLLQQAVKTKNLTAAKRKDKLDRFDEAFTAHNTCIKAIKKYSDIQPVFTKRMTEILEADLPDDPAMVKKLAPICAEAVRNCAAHFVFAADPQCFDKVVQLLNRLDDLKAADEQQQQKQEDALDTAA